MLRLLSIPLALLILLAGAMAWSGSATSHRADFVFINRGDIITLDPNQMSYLQDMRMAYAMWEGLYTYEPITLEPIPGVASSADVSNDKRVYTFHLRPEAKWSNGDPVTTADFVFAWRRMLESPGEYTYLFYYIKGAEEYVTAYAKGETPDFATVGVEAVDKHTLRVTLNDPVPFFLDICAFPPFLPLHKPSMERFAQRDATTGRVRYDQKFTRPPFVVTNGPFTLRRWDFKRGLYLEKNEHYWDAASVRSKSIEMVVVEDALSQLLRYESGSVDWVASVPTEVAAELKTKGRTDLRNFSGFGTTYLSFMVRPKLNSGQANPLSDIRVRLAMGMVIDKQSIVETISRMGEIPARTFVPPKIFPGYEAQQGIGYDVERAKRLLAEAGYPNGGALPGVSYLFRSDLPSAKELAQNLTRQWKQKLNLDIPLESAELKVRRQRINDRDYTICSADWIGDYGDPSTFTDKYRSNSENNDSVWISKEYDRLVFEATKEADEQKRLRLLENAEKILLEEAPIFPLYYLTNQYLFRDEVKGVNTNPRNMTMFKGVYVERESR
jgi:oligopeptide transport system substrate-binding protein